MSHTRDWRQLDFFSLCTESQPQAGEYVEAHGKELCFDDLRQQIGGIVIIDQSTESHEWLMAVRVEKIIYNSHEQCERLVYYDGKKQRGLVNDYYFAGPNQPTSCRPVRVWEVQPSGY